MSIISVLINFIAYLHFHPEYRASLKDALISIGEGLITDLTSPILPLPELSNLTVPE